MQMDLELFIDFLDKAIQKEQEERAHKQWCSMLPFMSLKMLDYMSFAEYLDKISGANIDTRPTAEIIADIQNTHKKAKQKGG